MEVKDVPESDQGQSTFEVGPPSWTHENSKQSLPLAPFWWGPRWYLSGWDHGCSSALCAILLLKELLGWRDVLVWKERFGNVLRLGSKRNQYQVQDGPWRESSEWHTHR